MTRNTVFSRNDRRTSLLPQVLMLSLAFLLSPVACDVPVPPQDNGTIQDDDTPNAATVPSSSDDGNDDDGSDGTAENVDESSDSLRSLTSLAEADLIVAVPFPFDLDNIGTDDDCLQSGAGGGPCDADVQAGVGAGRGRDRRGAACTATDARSGSGGVTVPCWGGGEAEPFGRRLRR